MIVWYGIRDNGEKVHTSHEKLMEWARANDAAFHVVWSSAVRVRDVRLTRTPAAAREKGWDDLADMLEAFLRGGEA